MSKKKFSVSFLVCTECKHRNYTIRRRKDKKGTKLQLRKYCKYCRKHTLHKESR